MSQEAPDEFARRVQALNESLRAMENIATGQSADFLQVSEPLDPRVPAGVHQPTWMAINQKLGEIIVDKDPSVSTPFELPEDLAASELEREPAYEPQDFEPPVSPEPEDFLGAEDIPAPQQPEAPPMPEAVSFVQAAPPQGQQPTPQPTESRADQPQPVELNRDQKKQEQPPEMVERDVDPGVNAPAVDMGSQKTFAQMRAERSIETPIGMNVDPVKMGTGPVFVVPNVGQLPGEQGATLKSALSSGTNYKAALDRANRILPPAGRPPDFAPNTGGRGDSFYQQPTAADFSVSDVVGEAADAMDNNMEMLVAVIRRLVIGLQRATETLNGLNDRLDVEEEGDEF